MMLYPYYGLMIATSSGMRAHPQFLPARPLLADC